MNALREELNRLLAPEKGGRKPALRRSRLEDWLYATDLPEAADEGQREAALGRLRAAGWEYHIGEGWIQLRKPAPKPPEGWFSGSFGPEAACCRSLLERHTDRGQEEPWAAYALIRAGEEGAGAYETACRRLHREWAERLRRGQRLPEIDIQYFGGNRYADTAHRTRGVSDQDGERRQDRDGPV